MGFSDFLFAADRIGEEDANAVHYYGEMFKGIQKFSHSCWAVIRPPAMFPLDLS